MSELIRFEYWNGSGNIMTITSTLNGVLHGKSLRFNYLGKIAIITNWNHGDQHGCETMYDKGKIVSTVEFLDDKRDGPSMFYEYGSLYIERNYKNGYQHGASRKWQPDGEIEWENHYHKDKLHGLSYLVDFEDDYYIYGELVTKDLWRENVLIEKLSGIGEKS